MAKTLTAMAPAVTKTVVVGFIGGMEVGSFFDFAQEDGP